MADPVYAKLVSPYVTFSVDPHGVWTAHAWVSPPTGSKFWRVRLEVPAELMPRDVTLETMTPAPLPAAEPPPAPAGGDAALAPGETIVTAVDVSSTPEAAL